VGLHDVTIAFGLKRVNPSGDVLRSGTLYCQAPFDLKAPRFEDRGQMSK
jgi:hypothetical protein